MLLLCDWCIARIYHNILSTFLFCSFSFQISLKCSVLFYILYFQKIFNDLDIVIWTWSHCCCSKFYFQNCLSSMLYLTCAKRYYWDTYCLRGNWIYLYSFMFLLDLTVMGLLLSCYVDSWFHVWHTNAADFDIDSVENFWKHMVWLKVFVN